MNDFGVKIQYFFIIDRWQFQLYTNRVQPTIFCSRWSYFIFYRSNQVKTTAKSAPKGDFKPCPLICPRFCPRFIYPTWATTAIGLRQELTKAWFGDTSPLFSFLLPITVSQKNGWSNTADPPQPVSCPCPRQPLRRLASWCRPIPASLNWFKKFNFQRFKNEKNAY